jgi:hypothetical protein
MYHRRITAMGYRKDYDIDDIFLEQDFTSFFIRVLVKIGIEVSFKKNSRMLQNKKTEAI